MPTEVWLVVDCGPDWYDIAKIFDSEEKANKYLAEITCTPHGNWRIHDYEVE